MKDYLSKIAGILFFVVAFVLLVTAPQREQFSAPHLFGFLIFLIFGFLLVAGYIGTHPAASRLRREAPPDIAFRPIPLCDVPAQTFRFTRHSRGQILLISLCVALGFALLLLAWVVSRAFPSDGVWIGMPLVIAAVLCIWCPLRQWGMYIRVDPQGITGRLYFRTIAMTWEDVVALIAREHSIVFPGTHGFGAIGSLGKIYSVYSRKAKIDFTRHLTEADQLISILEAATGLQWR